MHGENNQMVRNEHTTKKSIQMKNAKQRTAKAIFVI